MPRLRTCKWLSGLPLSLSDTAQKKQSPSPQTSSAILLNSDNLVSSRGMELEAEAPCVAYCVFVLHLFASPRMLLSFATCTCSAHVISGQHNNLHILNYSVVIGQQIKL